MICEYALMCTNEATMAYEHPVLDLVAICDDCAGFMDRINAPREVLYYDLEEV